MATTAEPSSPPVAGRIYTSMAMGVLSVAGGTCLALLLLAHSESFESWMRSVRWEEARRTKNIVLPTGHLGDDADRVLNEEIPSTDHRRGGVYLMGMSSVLWALRLRDLPEEQRRLIHNDGVVGTGHVGQGLLLRYLVEREGLLDAGPAKTLVIFGTGYQNCGFPAFEGSILEKTLQRRGFYTVGPDRSIARSGMGPLERAFSLERSRLYGIADGLKQLAQNAIRDRVGYSRSRVKDIREYNRVRVAHMGPDWPETIDRELAALMASIDDLRAKGARVLVLLMPQGSWEANIPFDRAYNDKLLELSRARGLDVLDLHGLLDDDDFADSTHLAPTGMEKFERAVLPVCLDHLRSAGLLPAGAPR